MRCFVALRPDEAARRVLAETARQLTRSQSSARLLAQGDLHLTLAFIGELPDMDAVRLAAMLFNTFHGSLGWTIERLGTFPRARVLWAGGAADPGLGALACAVRSRLAQSRVPFDAKRFVPHITLARSYRAVAALPDRLPEPIACRFGPPHLMQSVARSAVERYRAVPPGGADS